MKRKMEMKKLKRKGLTLLELVVVMTILIALAGILVPLLPNMMKQAHTSTGATNMPELNKLFELHNTVERGYPNYLDNLTDGTDLYAGLPGGGAGLTTLDLNADTAASLNAAGITKVFNLTSDAVDDYTFECYGEGIVAPPLTGAADVTNGLTIAVLDDSELPKFKGTPGEVYAVFGVGQATPMVGNMMQDAPVHFGDEPGSKPNEVYSRYAAVFRVGDWVDTDPAVDSDLDGNFSNDRDSIDPAATARFVTTVGLHDGGIAAPWMAIKGFNGAHEHD
jgi:Tfp pilus assembly protein PilE